MGIRAEGLIRLTTVNEGIATGYENSRMHKYKQSLIYVMKSLVYVGKAYHMG
jgi:hypothetical protein